MQRKLISRLLVVGLIGSTLVTTGCFGSFGATRAIYGWNKGVSGNKFIQWVVFLGLNIIPVYPIGGVADLFIFNALEFWTGSNPMASRETPQTKEVALGENHTMRMTNYGDAMDVVVLRGHDVENQFTFVGDEKGMTMLDAQGQTIARVQDMDGAIQVVNALGQSLATYSEQEAQTVSSTFSSQGAEAAIDVARTFDGAEPSVAAR
jgi:hypothetical protein